MTSYTKLRIPMLEFCCVDSGLNHIKVYVSHAGWPTVFAVIYGKDEFSEIGMRKNVYEAYRWYKEAAQKFGVSIWVVYYWIERGVVQARRINRGSPYWIKLEAGKEKELFEWVCNSSRIVVKSV